MFARRCRSMSLVVLGARASRVGLSSVRHCRVGPDPGGWGGPCCRRRQVPRPPPTRASCRRRRSSRHMPARGSPPAQPEEEEPPAALPQLRPTDGAEDDPEETGDGISVVPAAASDGDMRAQTEVEAPRDGVMEVNKAALPAAGAADLRRDARTPEEIAAFEGVPAGYNPYLFQIEPEPLADRRTAELFRLEPYTAVGVRIGSFVLFPEAEVGGARQQQRLSQPCAARRQCARGARCRTPGVGLAHPRRRAQGQRARLLLSTEFQTEDDRAYTLEARGRLDLAKRTNIEALVSHQIDKAIRSTRDFPTDAAERGDIETNRAAAALNHRFNRLSLQLRGAITDVDYAPVSAIGGGIISNAERNFTQRDAALRTSWTISQKADVFAETAGSGPRVLCGAGGRHPALLARRALPPRRRVRPVGRHDPRRAERRLGPAAPRRWPARRDRGLHHRCQPGLARQRAHHFPADGQLGFRRYDVDGVGRRLVAPGGSGGAPRLPALSRSASPA